MNLYLIRHADAIPVGEQGITSDFDRPLSPVGHLQVHALAKTLIRVGVAIDQIVTSPLVRAHETAEGMAKAWSSPAPGVTICDELAPGGRRRQLARFLQKLEGERFALVGHLPDIGELAAWLIGNRRVNIDFPKAGSAYIECAESPEKGGGVLVWLATPDWYLSK
jgi:phosphohistidine phosphatase